MALISPILDVPIHHKEVSCMLESKLPLGIKSFAELRRNAAVYVDKTSCAYKLAVCDWPQILTRPCGFGKGTLLSTLEELFLHVVEPYDGHDSFFKGLAIEPLWHDEVRYLVLHLDFGELNLGCDTVAQFEQRLMTVLAEFCQGNGLSVLDNKQTFRKLLRALIDQLPSRSLVLLIDEVDIPRLVHANDEQELKAGTLLLRGLFATIKGHTDKCRSVIFTSTTRLHKLDLDAAGNSFIDVSDEDEFASCCGFTRAEIQYCFAEHLRSVAAVRGCKGRMRARRCEPSSNRKPVRRHGGML